MWICILIAVLLIIGSCLITTEEKRLPTYNNNDKDRAISEKVEKTIPRAKVKSRITE